MRQYLPGDTIVAAATPPGASAVALLRLSGPRAWVIGAALLKEKVDHRGLEPQRAYVREIELPLSFAAISEAHSLSERAVLTFWRAPRSYSGEDMAEIAVHGNPLLLRLLQSACEAKGARPAEAGEFSYRAYLNGKLDLAQAEAVSELISAGSTRALAIAAAALAGTPSARVRGWSQRLVELIAGIEVIHDYASDDLDASLDPALLLTHDRLASALLPLRAELDEALEQSRRSAPLREGISVAICGPPNAGKSTLFNALLGYERSLTAPTPGTTRDYVSETLEASGLRLTLVDTAGWRETADSVEAAGVQRAGDWARSADRLLWVEAADARSAGPPPQMLTEQPALRVLTRCDLLAEWPEADSGELCVSGLTGRGVPELWAALAAIPDGLSEAALSSYGARQSACIAESSAALSRALEAVETALPFDIVAAELYDALHALRAVYEAPEHSAVVNEIFGAFCVGK